MDDSSDSALSSAPPSPLSSPLSMRSKSPTPPCDYPSPSVTLLSGSRSPSKALDPSSGTLHSDEPSPAKKRKLAEQRPRTTEYLDLDDFENNCHEEKDQNAEIRLQRLLKALRTKQKIVVIAGAGISVSAGIPDFRSSTGLFTTLRSQHKLKASGKHLFDASVYRSDSSTTSFHDMVRELSHLTRKAEPTPFHHMLATLAEEGRLMRLYTQNVDGIDTSLEPLATHVPLNPKGPWPKTVQLHGGLEKMVCTKCGDLSDFDGTLFEGPEPPSCKACETMEYVRINHGGKRSHGVGRLRPRIVLYNEFNPEEEAIGAVTRNDLRNRPDAVLVVGTSLKVPGVRRIAREMCAVTRGRRDGFTAWINHGPEPVGNEFKDCWDLVVRGDCDEVARHAALPKWDDKDIGCYSAVTDEHVAKATSQAKMQVIVERRHNVVESGKAIPTPIASPLRRSPAPSASAKIPKLSLKYTLGVAESSKKSKPSSKTTAKKKTSKKPAVKKPSNRITNTFTVTKAKATSAKPAKAPLHGGLTLFPNLVTRPPISPMRPISPVEVRNNSDIRSYSPQEEDSKLLVAQLMVDIPESYSDDNQQYKRETISPKGNLPSNMAHLIDVD